MFSLDRGRIFSVNMGKKKVFNELLLANIQERGLLLCREGSMILIAQMNMLQS